MRGFMAGQVGRTVSLLTETADGGHSEHFAAVRLAVAHGTGAGDGGEGGRRRG